MRPPKPSSTARLAYLFTQFALKSIDKVPASIGLVISAAMVFGGIILGFRTLPPLFSSTSANTLALSSVVEFPSLDLHLGSSDGNSDEVANQVESKPTPLSDAPSDLSESDSPESLGSDSPARNSSMQTSDEATDKESSASETRSSTESTSITPTAADAPVQVAYASTPPIPIQEWVNSHPTLSFVSAADVNTELPAIHIGVDRQNGIPVFRQTFAAATSFGTLESDISLAQIKAIWRGAVEALIAEGTLSAEEQPAFTNIAVLQEDVAALTALLGAPSASVEFATSTEGLKEAAKRADPALIILPFEKLFPSLVVLAVNAQNPVENVNNYSDAAYPLKAVYYLRWQGFTRADQNILDALIHSIPSTHRDPSKLTVVAMTGVTAMVRGTAAQMDRFGSAWPAEEIGPGLASADITHISNEVPFVPDCETNTSSSNLVFCSKLSYLDTLNACGVDIIGLTGNHQNDYGREDAMGSLAFYAENNLPVYGGGANREAANAPLYIEHNGNRLAFLGANSYGPDFAWATEDRPGSAQFDLNIMSANIRAVKENDYADVVFAELQYQETYEVMPLIEQRIDFNALLRAGADIVTGVQSHVPQALEFTDGKLVLYGLGNLFFDQMWSQPTREGLVVKHTIYDGRHISTQLLPTMLHDFGQPHWATPQEREYLLRRVFQASYWE